MANSPDDANLAVFCDFENVALGVRDAKYERFDIKRVLERLLLKGSIVVKKAYCDWERYKEFKTAMHGASFELIEIPHVRQSGKNSADIRMVVDALDLCYTKSHVDTFVIISGDSDFSPLVSKLRENNKTVIGVGVKSSTSDLLINNCDEFIYYDDLVRDQPRRRAASRSRGGGRGDAKPERPERAEAAERGDKAERADRPERADKPERGGSRRRGRGGRGERGEAAERDGGVTPADAAPGAAEDGGAEGLGIADATAAEPLDLFATDAAANLEAPETPAADETAHDRDDQDDRDDAPADRRQEAFDLVAETLDALIAERGADELVWGSMIKQTLRRRKPGFAEGYYGFRSFNALLEEAQAAGLVQLERDGKSGGYRVRPVAA